VRLAPAATLATHLQRVAIVQMIRCTSEIAMLKNDALGCLGRLRGRKETNGEHAHEREQCCGMTQ
jgi:hypothetical protein